MAACQNFITNDSHKLSIAVRATSCAGVSHTVANGRLAFFCIREQQAVTTKAVHRQDYMRHGSAPRNFPHSPSLCAEIRGYTTADSARAFIVSRSHGAISFPPPPHPRKSLPCCISQHFMTAALPHGEPWRRHPISSHRGSSIQYVTS